MPPISTLFMPNSLQSHHSFTALLFRVHIPNQSYVCLFVCLFFPSSHIHMWELDHKKGWAPKNWPFQIVVLEKNVESPLNRKEVKPVNANGNQPWIFIGRTDAEAEALILWSPDGKQLIHRKRLWCWKMLKTGKGDNRGWDGWMSSLAQWPQVWANSGRWRRTGKPGVLQSMGYQRIGHDRATEQQQQQRYGHKQDIQGNIGQITCHIGSFL